MQHAATSPVGQELSRLGGKEPTLGMAGWEGAQQRQRGEGEQRTGALRAGSCPPPWLLASFPVGEFAIRA
eukprot:3651598-Rhodomonas_salina.1